MVSHKKHRHSSFWLIWLSFFCLFVSLIACKQPNDTKWQFAPDMADAPTPKSQSAPIDPPDHAVSMEATLYMATETQTEDMDIYHDYFASETPAKRAFYLKQGEKLFQTFCKHCHGVAGKGDGSITDVYPKPPDITSLPYHERKGGYFFYKITFGGAMMPSLGHAISERERFKILLYIRSLQDQVKAEQVREPEDSEE